MIGSPQEQQTGQDFMTQAHDPSTHEHGGQDVTAAHQTYDGFIRLVKVSTPIILLLAAFVVFLLTR